MVSIGERCSLAANEPPLTGEVILKIALPVRGGSLAAKEQRSPIATTEEAMGGGGKWSSTSPFHLLHDCNRVAPLLGSQWARWLPRSGATLFQPQRRIRMEVEGRREEHIVNANYSFNFIVCSNFIYSAHDISCFMDIYLGKVEIWRKYKRNKIVLCLRLLHQQ